MPADRAISSASMAAQRLHARLGTDWDRPVDVFRIVQEQGIWLASRPLGAGLYGFYLREGDAAGIVLNADHPETLQRYTCAHELGHHVLGHRSHLDDQEDVVGPTTGHHRDEIAAQVFAGSLLMPLQAVNRVLRRLDLGKGSRLQATDVYRVSRALDVSFSAAAWQLVSLGRLDAGQAQVFVQNGSAAAKRALRPGAHPDGDNRAGLFILDERSHNIPLLCRPGDELRLRLPENASTGHVWRVAAPAQSASVGTRLDWDGEQRVAPAFEAAKPALDGRPVLRLAQDNYRDVAPGRPSTTGQPGTREFVFVATGPGRSRLHTELSRPWEDVALDSFSTTVRIGPEHSLSGFAQGQLVAHAARVAVS